MEWLKYAVLAIVALILFDQIALWMERRGWLYYRYRKPTGGGVSSAINEFHSLLNPSAKNIIELKQKTGKDRKDRGDGTPPNQ